MSGKINMESLSSLHFLIFEINGKGPKVEWSLFILAWLSLTLSNMSSVTVELVKMSSLSTVSQLSLAKQLFFLFAQPQILMMKNWTISRKRMTKQLRSQTSSAVTEQHKGAEDLEVEEDYEAYDTPSPDLTVLSMLISMRMMRRRRKSLGRSGGRQKDI